MDAATASPVDIRKVAKDPKSGLFYRTNTVDLAIIHGDAKGYLRKVPLVAGDRVLDIGAHVGGSVAAFANAGAEFVVGVEPDPDNFKLCKWNTPKGHLAIHAAAVHDDRATVTLWQNVRPRGTVFHSLTEHRGRTAVIVPAVNMAKLIAEHRITYLKMDCEGGEYDLLSVPLASSIRCLVVEFHANHKSWPPRVEPTLRSLYGQGFLPDRNPVRPTETAWVWTVAWRRKPVG